MSDLQKQSPTLEPPVEFLWQVEQHGWRGVAFQSSLNEGHFAPKIPPDGSIYFGTQLEVVSYDILTGKKRWRRAVADPRRALGGPRPTIVGDRIFSAVVEEKPDPTLQEDNSFYSVRILCLNRTDGELVWETRIDGLAHPLSGREPGLYLLGLRDFLAVAFSDLRGENLYLPENLLFLDYGSGKILRQRSIPPDREKERFWGYDEVGVITRPVLHGNTLHVLYSLGYMRNGGIASVSLPQGEVVGDEPVQLPGIVPRDVRPVRDGIFIAGKGLQKLSFSSGKVLRIQTGKSVLSLLASDSKAVYCRSVKEFGPDTPTFLEKISSDGGLIWSREYPRDEAPDSAVLTERYLIVDGGKGGAVSFLDPETGDTKYTFRHRSLRGDFDLVAATGNLLFVKNLEPKVICLKGGSTQN